MGSVSFHTFFCNFCPKKIQISSDGQTATARFSYKMESCDMYIQITIINMACMCEICYLRTNHECITCGKHFESIQSIFLIFVNITIYRFSKILMICKYKKKIVNIRKYF